MRHIQTGLQQLLFGVAVVCGSCVSAKTQDTRSPGVPNAAQRASALGHWGDQGDNTFVNPILPGDFSDLDAIRVGKEFFAISSTMQYAPGMAILQSSDLINWRIVSHVVSDISALDPELGWERMDRAGRGIWAGSIRYHAGQFWVYFGTPDGGIYVSTAPTATGPWSPAKLVIAEAGWDDPCPFWDDDGKAYLVATRFAPDRDGEQYRIHLFSMTQDGRHVRSESDRILHQSQGSEANKMYKIDGTYLHYFSEVRAEGRVAMMERAKSLSGPWEVHQLNHVNPKIDKEPNQGGLIQTADRRWWFLTHQGTGDWEGRAGVLLPVTWIDGWPIPGRPGVDGIGEMVWGGEKPFRSKVSRSRLSKRPFMTDGFNEQSLDPAWEWRYQPRADHWSLTGEALRLWAFEPLPGRDFAGVRNVLTQRSARSRHSEVTVMVHLDGIEDDQEAGLAHFALTDARIAVVQRAGVHRIVRIDGRDQTFDAPFSGNTVWLRSFWGVEGLAKFAYSLDGQTFTEVGSPYQMSWGAYRGDRIGLYTSATNPKSGYVDFSDFRYTVER